MGNVLKAPFPYFGGKSTVAAAVWEMLGEVDNSIEPFAGSLAVLLGRPVGFSGAETVNDVDAYLSNFWRALSEEPEEVARYADWPVSEVDLTARHVWLVNRKAEFAERLMGDPGYYCVRSAGWWVWGISSWIGSGWCSGDGPWNTDGEKLVKKDRGGVRRKIPHLGDAGQGVNRQLPHLGDAGQGVNRSGDLTAYMTALAERLARVRVCCGDWRRVVTNGAMNYGKTVGVFLDPPYGFADRDTVYNNDSRAITADVIEWCREYADNPRVRIALCGYGEEFEGIDLFHDWTWQSWKANISFGTTASSARGANQNRHKEVILYSPSCVKEHPGLFAMFGDAKNKS